MAKKKKGSFSWYDKHVVFNLAAREKFYAHFEMEMNAGNTLSAAQKNYMTLISGGRNKSLRKIMDKVFDSRKQGTSFGDRFEDLLPFDERLILNAAGQSGSELEMFVLLRERVAHKKNSSLLPMLALLYPLATVLVGLNTWVSFGGRLARMEQGMMGGTKFHGKLGDMVYVATNIEWLGPVTVLGLLAISAMFVKSLPNWTGPLRTKFDQFPPYSIYRNLQSVNFLITYAALRKRGMNEKEALQTLCKYSVPWLAVRIKTILDLMRGRGIGFSEASIKAGFNIPNKEHALALRSMNQNRDFGQRLLEFAKEVQKTVMARIKAILGVVFFVLLVLGLFTTYAISSASGEISQQVNASRNKF